MDQPAPAIDAPGPATPTTVQEHRPCLVCGYDIFGRPVALMLTGWWMFTTPDEALARADPAFRARRAIRILLGISAGAALASFAMTMFPALRAPLIESLGKGSISTPALTIVSIVGS